MSCLHLESGVVDTRRDIVDGTSVIKRKRLCKTCGNHFNTVEGSISMVNGIRDKSIADRILNDLKNQINGLFVARDLNG